MKAKSDPIIIDKLHKKLIEASQVYSKDKETVSWLVMQSVFDKREFTIVRLLFAPGPQVSFLGQNPKLLVTVQWRLIQAS